MFVFFAGVFDPIHLIQQSKLWFFKIEAPNMYGKVSVERYVSCPTPVLMTGA